MPSDSNEAKARANARSGPGKPGIARLNVQADVPMPEALQLVPEDIARKYNVLPQSLDGNTLRVYMANPSDILTIENLSIYTKKGLSRYLPQRQISKKPSITTTKRLRTAAGVATGLLQARQRLMSALLMKHPIRL